MEARLTALEGVLVETRLSADLMVLAIGMIAARHDPGHLDEAAEAMLGMTNKGVDAALLPRLCEAQAHAAEILRDAARGMRGGLAIAELIRAPTQGGVQ